MLVCTSGGPASDHPVGWGLRLAEANDAKATFLHVASAAPEMYAGLPLLTEDLAHVMSRDTPLSKHLREIAVKADKAGVEADLELRHGMVAEEIIRACEMRTLDFIVLGAARSPAGVDTLLLDQVTPHVLSTISCSILVVRGEGK
jgi:nucleotide-binding universal stress UspA family protein